MPVYQYACTECGEEFEARQSFTDAALTVCPRCSGRLRKVLTPVGVVFKGSGFYRTDSRAAEKAAANGAAKPTKDGAATPAKVGAASSDKSANGTGNAGTTEGARSRGSAGSGSSEKTSASTSS